MTDNILVLHPKCFPYIRATWFLETCDVFSRPEYSNWLNRYLQQWHVIMMSCSVEGIINLWYFWTYKWNFASFIYTYYKFWWPPVKINSYMTQEFDFPKKLSFSLFAALWSCVISWQLHFLLLYDKLTSGNAAGCWVQLDTASMISV